MDFINRFEAGVLGGGISAANSGGDSGDQFDSAQVGASSTLTYDNVHTLRGSRSALISGGSGVSTFLAKNFPAGSAHATGRAGYYLTANPAATLPILGHYSGSTVRVRVSITSTGKLIINSPSGGSLTSTFSIPLNAWFLAELIAVCDAVTGTSDVRLYSDPFSTAFQNFGQTNVNYGGTADRTRVGVGTNASGAIPSLWMDEVAINDTGAPIGSIARDSDGQFFMAA